MSERIELLESSVWRTKYDEATDAERADFEYGVVKYNVGEVKSPPADDEEGDRSLTFTVSDSDLDRDDDKIDLKGWDLKQFRKNPVILWAHDSFSPPIGRAKRVWNEDDKLRELIEFADADLSPMGDMVFRMLKRKFLRATSVGFRPTKWKFSEDEERKGIDFAKQEMLETSIVPVPSNPRALAGKAGPLEVSLLKAHEAGIETAPLRQWCERMLDLKKQLKGVTPSDIEGAWKASAGRPVIIDMAAKRLDWVQPIEDPEEPVVDPRWTADEWTPNTTTVVRNLGDGEDGPYIDTDRGRFYLNPPPSKTSGPEELESEVAELRVHKIGAEAVEGALERIRVDPPTIQREGDLWAVKRGPIVVARVADPSALAFAEDGALVLDPLPQVAEPQPLVVQVTEEDTEDYVIEFTPDPPAPEDVIDEEAEDDPVPAPELEVEPVMSLEDVYDAAREMAATA